jgi:hypothetical protein
VTCGEWASDKKKRALEAAGLQASKALYFTGRKRAQSLLSLYFAGVATNPWANVGLGIVKPTS